MEVLVNQLADYVELKFLREVGTVEWRGWGKEFLACC